VNKTKGLVVLGVAAVSTAFAIIHYVRLSTTREPDASADTGGVVNPESAKAGLTTQPVPELSARTFKPAPSSITGSYTEPAANKKPVAPEAAEKKADK
jgi:hypothetical protein